MATGPLDGMRVLDFTTTIAGPYCTRLMADLGAEVIKIETDEGDMMRTRPPLRDGASTSFGQLNAGKQSIVLDLKRPEAQEVVRRLLTTCDFVVENFRPGVMKRFNLDYETVSKRHQELIYCSISGYGQSGPSSGLAAYAPAIHAASGFDMAHMAYQPGRDRPDNCGIYIADIVSGTYAFGAIMAALAQRHSTGLGQHIDVSMLETMLTLMVGEVQTAQFPVAPPGRPMFGPVRTRDGFIMPAVASEKTFQSLCQAAGRPEWITDPQFALYPDRRNNWGAFVDLLETWSTTLSTADCQVAFDAAGVPGSPYRTVKEVLDDPQLAHRRALAEVTDKSGAFKVINAPFRMSGAPVRVAGFASALGENTREILELAGYAAEEIEKMSTEGIVGIKE
jgi:crotonobetainyl-CoA:carnitine CoA-transferase CaiB-like acyl-CoA transferase